MSFYDKLKYSLTASSSYYANKPVLITFRLENVSEEDLWILRWYTPFEGIKGKIFRFLLAGKEIPYEGPMIKRGQPTKDDYIGIKNGDSVSAQVDLLCAYTIEENDEYVLEFSGRIYDVASSLDSVPRQAEMHRMVKIKGNRVSFRVTVT